MLGFHIVGDWSGTAIPTLMLSPRTEKREREEASSGAEAYSEGNPQWTTTTEAECVMALNGASQRLPDLRRHGAVVHRAEKFRVVGGASSRTVRWTVPFCRDTRA